MPLHKAQVENAAKAILTPALHTFWQTFSGLIGVWWIASGLGAAHQIADVASAKRFAFALLTATAGAALSALKTTVVHAVSTAKDDPAQLAAIDALLSQPGAVSTDGSAHDGTAGVKTA